MKRLTMWYDGNQAICENEECSLSDCPFADPICEQVQNIIDRLASIEDILGDEYDLEQLNKALWCKKVVETAFSDDTRAVERLRELWFADQKGHCVVFDEHYPMVSEYYQDEDGRYIRESSGVISEAEYMAAKGGALK